MTLEKASMQDNNNEIWVFLSHSYKDYEKVRQVRNLLEQQKLRPLMFFLRCLKDEKEIDSLIKREIDCRTRFIYCESKNSQESEWVKEEVKYIKSKDRIFETINLDLPIYEIERLLNNFRKETNIYISYQRDDIKLAKAITNRLKKYEFKVWTAHSDLQASLDFASQIEHALLNAASNGYVLLLLNESILFPYGWTRIELKIALEKSEHSDRRIIPVIQDKLLWDNLSKDPELQTLYSLKVIDSSMVEQPTRCDYIVDEFLMRVLPPGAIFSHAQNFEKGFYGRKDLQEAMKLYALCFKIATRQEKMGNTACYSVLGYCYEHGYGTMRNLNSALEYYRMAAKSFPQYQNDYQRLYQQLHRNKIRRNFNSHSIWNTFRKIWRNNVAR